jgi:hypothetical protein
LHRTFLTTDVGTFCELGTPGEHVGASTVIPAGSYAIAANVNVYSALTSLLTGGALNTIFRCRLYANDVVIAGGSLTLDRYDVGPIPMVAAAQSGGDITLEIRCTHDAGGCPDSSGLRFRMESQAITATRVELLQ